MKREKIVADSIRKTKKQIKASVTEDQHIIQAIRLIDELHKIANILAKRLRDWYELYFPELSHKIDDHEEFVTACLKPRKDLVKEYNIKSVMGADVEEKDLKAIEALAKQVQNVYRLRDQQLKYIDTACKSMMPNTFKLLGGSITARLIGIAGSFKNLAMMTSGTIQVLGAEKAFFRHLKQGSKMPKYGIILQHPSFNKAPRKQHGKIARKLAAEANIAIKKDYFKDKK